MEDTTATRSSFLDEDLEFDALLEDGDDEPTAVRRVLGGRKRDAYRPARVGRSASPNWSRIAAALFVLAVLLFVVGFGVKSFLDHRQTSAYQSYFEQVGDVTAQSGVQGKELSTLLVQAQGTDRAQIISRLDKLSKRADKSVTAARAIDAPDEMKTTHQWLVTSLEYRRNGLDNLRKAMTTALASKRQRSAAVAVAAASRRLVASDVIYQDSYATSAGSVLKAQNIEGVIVPDSAFVADPEFASIKATTLMLERLSSGAAATKKGKKQVFKDGKLRGGELQQVTMSPSGLNLSTTTTTQVASSSSLAFEVTFKNQGEVQATQVPVIITMKGSSSEPQELTAVIERVDPGGVGSVRVPLKDVPPFGETMTVTVKAGPIPGEENGDNNSATYNVLFKL